MTTTHVDTGHQEAVLAAARKVLQRASEGSVQALTEAHAVALRGLIWDLQAELGRHRAWREGLARREAAWAARESQLVGLVVAEEQARVAAEERAKGAVARLAAILSTFPVRSTQNSKYGWAKPINEARAWVNGDAAVAPCACAAKGGR